MRNLLLKLIRFYQRYLTVISFGSCRYYPSCSEYAMQQFQKNNILVASYLSTKRILRCNQLFIGGIDYPVIPCGRLFSKVSSMSHDIEIKFWLVPKDDQYCYVIKSFSSSH